MIFYNLDKKTGDERILVRCDEGIIELARFRLIKKLKTFHFGFFNRLARKKLGKVIPEITISEDTVETIFRLVNNKNKEDRVRAIEAFTFSQVPGCSEKGLPRVKIEAERDENGESEKITFFILDKHEKKLGFFALYGNERIEEFSSSLESILHIKEKKNVA